MGAKTVEMCCLPVLEARSLNQELSELVSSEGCEVRIHGGHHIYTALFLVHVHIFPFFFFFKHTSHVELGLVLMTSF